MKPKKTGLTDQELEIMKVVWNRGAATVRDVYEELLKHRKIAYTTVQTMMGVLEHKGRLKKETDDRAYVYRPAQSQKEVVGSMVGDFVKRVFNGSAKLRLGGEHGQTVELRSGDVILIPAGVAHQSIAASPDFNVVGAYPDGRQWDLLRGLPGERPKSDHTIAALPIPDYDPIYGVDGPLRQIWKSPRAA
jgi:predicted transcriptional regulator